MKKKLVINDKAKIINFRNRKVRTPVTLTITDSELKPLLTQIRMANIRKWMIEELTNELIKEDAEVIDFDYIDETKDMVEIEELNVDPITILEKFIKDGDRE